MENTKAVIGGILFIVAVIGVNFVMYGIVRGATRSNNKSMLEIIGKSLSSANVKKDQPMEELRRRVDDLSGGKKDDSSDSE